MNKSLMTYFIILFLLCTGFVAGARTLGEMGVYLAGAYTLTPAMAALITRLFSIARASKMPVSNLAGSGITSSSGLFAWHYLIVLIFPGIISGFGEEFGHRGFMFPLLYPNEPWLSLLLGGFLFYLWHQPLLLVIPSGPEVPLWQTTVTHVSAITGSIATHTYLSYVYAKSRSIFVPSIAHIALNNSARSFSYFVLIQNQFTANIVQSLVMVLIIVFLYYRKELTVIPEFLSAKVAREHVREDTSHPTEQVAEKGVRHVVQPNDDLALALSIPWDDQQGGDACLGNRKKKWKDHLDPNQLLA